MTPNIDLLEHLMNTYGDSLKRTAYVMLGDLELAEDMTQETFISFYKSQGFFLNKASYKTYLYRILVNHVKMHWRKQKKEALVPSFDCYDALHCFSFEDNLVLSIDMNRALMHLKEVDRFVIILHYFNGYTVDDISSILNVSTSAVKMKLSRGKEKLKPHLMKGASS